MPITITEENAKDYVGKKLFTQDDIDSYVADKRRAEAELKEAKAEAGKVPTLDEQIKALTGERDTLKGDKEKLEATVKESSQRETATQKLLAGGAKPDRIDKILKLLPADADFSDDEKTKATLDKVKTDISEWFAPAQDKPGSSPRTPDTKVPGSNGVKNSPTEPGGKPAPASLGEAIREHYQKKE